MPGARLIPLGELAVRVGDIHASKPTIVYCRSGNRSMAATTTLLGAGLKQVINMAGGITAWSGLVSSGPPEAGMAHFTTPAKPEELIALAWALEEGSRRALAARFGAGVLIVPRLVSFSLEGRGSDAPPGLGEDGVGWGASWNAEDPLQLSLMVVDGASGVVRAGQGEYLASERPYGIFGTVEEVTLTARYQSGTDRLRWQDPSAHLRSHGPACPSTCQPVYS